MSQMPRTLHLKSSRCPSPRQLSWCHRHLLLLLDQTCSHPGLFSPSLNCQMPKTTTSLTASPTPQEPPGCGCWRPLDSAKKSLLPAHTVHAPNLSPRWHSLHPESKRSPGRGDKNPPAVTSPDPSPGPPSVCSGHGASLRLSEQAGLVPSMALAAALTKPGSLSRQVPARRISQLTHRFA